MKGKIAFVLSYFNNPVGVIVVDEMDLDSTNLRSKIEEAIKEEVTADDDSQFELRLHWIGDYGETSKLSVTYVTDGVQLVDDEFTIMKTVMY